LTICLLLPPVEGRILCSTRLEPKALGADGGLCFYYQLESKKYDTKMICLYCMAVQHPTDMFVYNPLSTQGFSPITHYDGIFTKTCYTLAQYCVPSQLMGMHGCFGASSPALGTCYRRFLLHDMKHIILTECCWEHNWSCRQSSSSLDSDFACAVVYITRERMKRCVTAWRHTG
jgi:hypothetical protein